MVFTKRRGWSADYGLAGAGMVRRLRLVPPVGIGAGMGLTVGPGAGLILVVGLAPVGLVTGIEPVVTGAFGAVAAAGAAPVAGFAPASAARGLTAVVLAGGFR